MSNHNKKIVDALVTEDLFTAKKLINKALMEKMNSALEEKLINYAPTVFNEGKLSPKQKKIAAMAGDKDKIEGEDFKKLRKLKESEELFEAELKSLIEEIEAETGEPLSEEEVVGIANDLLDVMNDNLEGDDCPDCGDESEEDSDSDDDYVYGDEEDNR